MPNIERIVIFATAICILLAATPSSAQTTLRWQFEPGQELHQVIEQSMQMTTKADGQTRNSTHDHTIESRWKVEAVSDDGVANLLQQIKRIHVKIRHPDGNIEVDSESPEQAINAPASIVAAIQAMAKAEFSLQMATPTGVIDDVKFSASTEKALELLPVSGQLGGNFSKDSLVNIIKQGTPVFPAEPIEKGASWSTTTEVPMAPLGKLVSDAKMTYAGPESAGDTPLERIDVDVTTRFVPVAGQVVQIAIEGGRSTGALLFDNEAGRLRRSELVQDVGITFTLGASIITQKVKQTIKVELND